MTTKTSKRIVALAVICSVLLMGYLGWKDRQVDHSGWKQLSTGMGYRDFRGDFVTGWQEIDGEHYYFNDDYALVTGWFTEGNVTYYLDEQGKRVSGWFDIDGNSYCFDDNGHLLTGWVERNGVIVYLGEDGLPVSGWFTDAGNTYYLDESGSPCTGMLTLDGATITIRCSDARYISLESSNRFALIANPIHNDGLLREATFDISRWLTLTEDSPNDWFRIVIHGPYGHYASTRAYFRDELK